MHEGETLNDAAKIKFPFSRLLRPSLTLSIGLTILTILVTLALLEPQINGYRLNGVLSTSLGTYGRYLPLSYEHPLGTELYGRDVLALLITGLRNSLLIGFLAGGMSIVVATVVATVAGYMGGLSDRFLNSMTNAVLVTPSLPILMAAASFIKVDALLMSGILAVFSWPWAARTIRAQMLSLKERTYVDLARVSGLNSFEIMFLEIVPNLLPFIGVGFAYSIIGAILTETGLRMIGVGPGELHTLGQLLNSALNTGAMSLGYYHILMAPILALIMIFISLQLINIGLEELFNPRLKKITGL